MTRKTALAAVAVLLACTHAGGRPRAAAGSEPCLDRLQAGRWVRMADLPDARAELGQSFRAGGRVLTWLTYEPPTGALYDLCTDRWEPAATQGAPRRSGSRFRTGEEVVVVPDQSATAFDLFRNAWTPRGALPAGRDVNQAIAPPGALFLLFVREPMKFGDFTPGDVLWDLRTAASSPLGGEPPASRVGYAFAWLNDRLAVWGGVDASSGPKWPPRKVRSDGAVLERRGDRWAWRPMSSKGAPSERSPAVFAGTGSRLVVWGGWGPVPGKPIECLNDGGVYDAVADAWRPIPTEGAPEARSGAAAIATGKWFVVFGGQSDCSQTRKQFANGGVFDLDAGTWRSFTLPGPTTQEYAETAVLADGRIAILPRIPNGIVGEWMAVLDPATAQVTRVEIPAALRGRMGTQIVFTGRRLLLFGGYRDLTSSTPCPEGIWPCDRADQTTEVRPDGMIYSF